MENVSATTDPDCDSGSGSDAISQLSTGVPARETDRFGFILGTGLSSDCEGPPPEVIRQREAKWLEIISHWDRFLLKKSSKVKSQCRKGIPPSLRARCWPLLCAATAKMSTYNKIYEMLDSSEALQSWVDVIERDIDRQFPFHEMFLSRDGHGQQGLFRVLKAYTQFRPEEGYCQGQGPVAAVLLMNMPAEEAFWCLVQISEQYLPGYYSPLLGGDTAIPLSLQEGVLFDSRLFSSVLRRACPVADKHLRKHGVEPLMYLTDWFMCLYTRNLPFNTLLRVWDIFFSEGVKVLFKVAVVLVRMALGSSEKTKECDGQMETLERLRTINDKNLQEDTFIEEVCAVSLSVKDVEKETEKELERWRADRPQSTFDPRSRCHGYRAAWEKVRREEEERVRRERKQGNLTNPSHSSVPNKKHKGSRTQTELLRTGSNSENTDLGHNPNADGALGPGRPVCVGNGLRERDLEGKKEELTMCESQDLSHTTPSGELSRAAADHTGAAVKPAEVTEPHSKTAEEPVRMNELTEPHSKTAEEPVRMKELTEPHSKTAEEPVRMNELTEPHNKSAEEPVHINENQSEVLEPSSEIGTGHSQVLERSTAVSRDHGELARESCEVTAGHSEAERDESGDSSQQHHCGTAEESSRSTTADTKATAEQSRLAEEQTTRQDTPAPAEGPALEQAQLAPAADRGETAADLGNVLENGTETRAEHGSTLQAPGPIPVGPSSAEGLGLLPTNSGQLADDHSDFSKEPNSEVTKDTEAHVADAGDRHTSECYTDADDTTSATDQCDGVSRGQGDTPNCYSGTTASREGTTDANTEQTAQVLLPGEPAHLEQGEGNTASCQPAAPTPHPDTLTIPSLPQNMCRHGLSQSTPDLRKATTSSNTTRPPSSADHGHRRPGMLPVTDLLEDGDRGELVGTSCLEQEEGNLRKSKSSSCLESGRGEIRPDPRNKPCVHISQPVQGPAATASLGETAVATGSATSPQESNTHPGPADGIQKESDIPDPGTGVQVDLENLETESPREHLGTQGRLQSDMSGTESEADFQSAKENQSRDTANTKAAGQESLCVEGLQSQSESDVGTDMIDHRATEAEVLTPETDLTLPEPICDSEVNPLPTTQEQSEPRDPRERREREEEKARKKREKEMEKERQKLERDRERERRKPQTRGKSFQVHSKCSHNMPPPGNKTTDNLVSKRNSAPYFDTYF
ncbi:TB10A protein, partial [Atractosteus spatula]|nr:TB10A protein [Atractosteus spatula]